MYLVVIIWLLLAWSAESSTARLYYLSGAGVYFFWGCLPRLASFILVSAKRITLIGSFWLFLDTSDIDCMSHASADDNQAIRLVTFHLNKARWGALSMPIPFPQKVNQVVIRLSEHDALGILHYHSDPTLGAGGQGGS